MLNLVRASYKLQSLTARCPGQRLPLTTPFHLDGDCTRDLLSLSTSEWIKKRHVEGF